MKFTTTFSLLALFSSVAMAMPLALPNADRTDMHATAEYNRVFYPRAVRTVVVTEVVTATVDAVAPVATAPPTVTKGNVVVVTEVYTAAASKGNTVYLTHVVTAGANQDATAPATTEAAVQSTTAEEVIPPTTAEEVVLSTTAEEVVPSTTSEEVILPTTAEATTSTTSEAVPSTTEQAVVSTTSSEAVVSTTASSSSSSSPANIGHAAQTTTSSSAAPQATSSTSGSSNSDQFTGDGTFYTPGLGACGQTHSDSDLIAAINAPQYGTTANPNNAPVCGKCALVNGPKGQVKVKIVDRCPVCKTGDLDLSPSAFEKVGDFDAGRITISWSFVDC